MSVTQSDVTTASEVYRSVRDLTPRIGERADEIERDRRVPRDLLEHLAEAGCYRLVRPETHGGIEADWPSAMRVYEALAAADGSTGWTVAIGSAGWCDLVGLPRSTFDAVFGPHPDTMTAGVFAPSGSIAAEGSAYRVQGRWGFASGCEDADWIYVNCVESVDDGVPAFRAALMTPDQVVIEDTWDVSGLRGTGSHHVRVDTLVPAAQTFVPLSDDPCVDVPIVRIPAPSLFAMGIASIATGVARGALDDVVALATGKTPLLDAGPLATNPRFQYELANADTALRAARAVLWEAAESAWAKAVAGTPFTPLDRARTRAAAAWAAQHAAGVVDAAYHAGGGSSIWATNPLQRRWRDANAITQHFLVKADTFTVAGAVLAGQPIAAPVF